jgi:hypothetical protein
MRKYMTNLTPIPVFSIFRRESAPRHIENLIALLRDGDQAREFSLAIHSPLDLLEELGGDIRKQLDPFLQSDRIAVLADSDCGALHGLYSERELAREMQNVGGRYASLFPGKSPVFMPRWHDHHRDEAARQYRENPAEILLPGGRPGHPCLFRAASALRDYIPVVDIAAGDGGRRAATRVVSTLRKLHRSIEQAAAADALHSSDEVSVILRFDGDHAESIGSGGEILSTLIAKGFHLSTGASDLHFLRLADRRNQNGQETDTSEIPPQRISCSSYDLPVMTPAFIAQRFPDSFPKKLRRSQMSASPLAKLSMPDQRVESARPEREVTANMQGRAELRENDLRALFIGGNISELADAAGKLTFSGGIHSRIITSRQGKERRTEYQLESAFALEASVSRGLRQTLKLADIECQIAGRIVNDFLQIEDMAEIIMDSYLQHPWIREGYEVERYAPQMLEVWNDIRADEQIDLRSENSDGSKRAFRFCPLDLLFDENGETMLMLPGMSWLLNRGPTGLGLELVHARRLKIDLPSAVLVTRRRREQYSLSFLPSGEYRRPSLEGLNGLLEHYSLRLRPNLRNSSDFPPMSRKALGHISHPFVIYY